METYAMLMAATSAPPAGGAAIGEVIGATAGAAVLTSLLVALGWAHRTGRSHLLGRVASRVAAAAGGPPWAVLPGQIAAISLLIAVFGMYWDISLHIAEGRDEGPLANPAHYFILAGLFGIFAAGFLAVVLPDERPSRASVRIAGDWYAPIGGIVMLACGAFALLGFPLDDVWHRLFGQDVTLWGPTHLMLIGGASLSLLGNAILLVEGGIHRPRVRQGPLGRAAAAFYRSRYAAVVGGLLVGLCTFQAEFDFGVPQFRLLFEPVMLAFAAGVGLVVARNYVGRGGALFAVGYFVAIRGVLALLVGPVLGEPTPYFPLFLVEALLVEGVALAIAPRARPLAFGAVCGALIGTVGFAAQYAWSHIWMPIPWPEALISEAAIVVPLTAVASGLLGGFVGACLSSPREPGAVRVPSVAVAATAAVAIAAVVGYGLQTDHVQGARAHVTLDDTRPAPQREVDATVRIDPASAAEDADWVRGIAWQGGGLVDAELEQTGAGTWQTTEPLPVYDGWKALVRVHKDSSVAGVPVYLPEDRAIPAEEVPAKDRFTRDLVPEKEILQRELKDDVPTALPPIAYLTVGAITLGLMVMLGWALARLAGTEGTPTARPAPAERRRAVPITAGGRA
jgi:hypothetical protein